MQPGFSEPITAQILLLAWCLGGHPLPEEVLRQWSATHLPLDRKQWDYLWKRTARLLSNVDMDVATFNAYKLLLTFQTVQSDEILTKAEHRLLRDLQAVLSRYSEELSWDDKKKSEKNEKNEKDEKDEKSKKSEKSAPLPPRHRRAKVKSSAGASTIEHALSASRRGLTLAEAAEDLGIRPSATSSARKLYCDRLRAFLRANPGKGSFSKSTITWGGEEYAFRRRVCAHPGCTQFESTSGIDSQLCRQHR